jgi:putative ABC transport system substrate-binding protein
MRRREVMFLLGSVAGWPRCAQGQQATSPVVGYLSLGAPGPAARITAGLRQGFAETGYVEGKNLRIEYRWAEGYYERLQALADDLVARKVDVIATSGGGPAARAAKKASETISIVFASGSDPVEDGFVTSFSRPGGNLTGVSLLSIEMTSKRLQLLLELVPQISALALLENPNNPNGRLTRDAQLAARNIGVQLHVVQASTGQEIDSVFDSLAKLGVGGVVVTTDASFNRWRDELLAHAAAYAVPAIYGFREFAVAGGLISYGPDFAAVYREVGIYVGKILHGAKPSDLPVQQPTSSSWSSISRRRKLSASRSHPRSLPAPTW